MMTLEYRGERRRWGCRVTVNGMALPPRHDLRNHSPDGYEWGYGGSGPAQLALAILAHFTGNDECALSYYQEFKRAVVAGLAHDEWALGGKQIDDWLTTGHG